VIMAPVGFAGIAFAITGNSTLQLTSAPDRRGRVMSLYTVVFLGSAPIGGPVAGWVGEHLGARVGFAAGGVVAVATGILALRALSGTRRLAGTDPARMVPAPVVDDLTE
jgi:MFS family permease